MKKIIDKINNLNKQADGSNKKLDKVYHQISVLVQQLFPYFIKDLEFEIETFYDDDDFLYIKNSGTIQLPYFGINSFKMKNVSFYIYQQSIRIQGPSLDVINILLSNNCKIKNLDYINNYVQNFSKRLTKFERIAMLLEPITKGENDGRDI